VGRSEPSVSSVKAISMDSHIHLTFRPAGTFTSRLPARFGQATFAPSNALTFQQGVGPMKADVRDNQIEPALKTLKEAHAEDWPVPGDETARAL